MPVTEMFWGYRNGVLEDPFAICGRWPQIRDLSPQQIEAAMHAQFGASEGAARR
jgi:hypothetical protein